MATKARAPPDWKELLRSWDLQQEAFNPDRERRFELMFDVVQATVPKRFTALDLGCGPGSLSARLLRRFPAARVVAVDYDPVSLRVGREALRAFRGRLTWVDAKLGALGWTDRLPARRIDVALSTTALHWLPERDLRLLYRDLGRLLPRGAVFLDGDHFPWGPRGEEFNRVAEKVRRVRFGGISLDREWTAWRRWWKRAEQIPELRSEFVERARREAKHPKGMMVPIEMHEYALARGGFRDVGVIWQDLSNRVLFARR
jgi:SAM-dependent methyltransferase